jgi:N-acetylglucosaminyldiphosphoundecaprenol N-acetyl-beta-D-mannosaminyltransferase
MNRINIWGIKINPLRKVEIVNIIDKHIANNDWAFHLTGVNVETIAHAQEDPALKIAINSSDIVNIDNMLVVTSLRLLGYRIPERAACPDIFELLMQLSDNKGYSVYFLGAKEEILQLTLNKLKAKYPKLHIAGSRNGYYRPEEELSIVKEIENLKPDMLFIALPSPQKELFIYNHKKDLGVRFAFGIGGVFDVQAGKVRRAPLWMRRIGLEGIHRTLQNPANYGKRYRRYYVPFVKLFFKELLSKKSNQTS